MGKTRNMEQGKGKEERKGKSLIYDKHLKRRHYILQIRSPRFNLNFLIFFFPPFPFSFLPSYIFNFYPFTLLHALRFYASVMS